MIRELLFTVTVDGVIIAGFAHIDDAEVFASRRAGLAEVRSRGDGYVYGAWRDGVLQVGEGV